MQARVVQVLKYIYFCKCKDAYGGLDISSSSCTHLTAAVVQLERLSRYLVCGWRLPLLYVMCCDINIVIFVIQSQLYHLSIAELRAVAALVLEV